MDDRAFPRGGRVANRWPAGPRCCKVECKPMAPRTEDARSTLPRLELANRLFHEFYAVCFWHLKPDLVVTEALIPLIVAGLRKHGGRRGMLAADRLLP